MSDTIWMIKHFDKFVQICTLKESADDIVAGIGPRAEAIAYVLESALAAAQKRIAELTEIDEFERCPTSVGSLAWLAERFKQRAESAESRLSALTTERDNLLTSRDDIVKSLEAERERVRTLKQRIERIYKPAAKRFGDLFCWCVENVQRFPPVSKDWIEGVKDKLSQLAALTTENERLAKLTEWHDIETAPKDGTKILVIKEYFDPYRKLPMSWHDIAYWTTHNSGGWVSATAGTPTHWRPLPPPPADGGAR